MMSEELYIQCRIYLLREIEHLKGFVKLGNEKSRMARAKRCLKELDSIWNGVKMR